jgi:hypothetical protein
MYGEMLMAWWNRSGSHFDTARRKNIETEEETVVRVTLHLLLLGNAGNIVICRLKVCILLSW